LSHRMIQTVQRLNATSVSIVMTIFNSASDAEKFRKINYLPENAQIGRIAELVAMASLHQALSMTAICSFLILHARTSYRVNTQVTRILSE
jgi:hypothetical protein